MRQSFRKTLSLIQSDLQKRCEYEKKSATVLQAVKFLFFPGFSAVMLYRLQHFFYTHHLSWVASVLKLVNQIIFSVSIDSDVKIGPRFMILHASYVVIGTGVTIGHDFMAVYNNSIIASPFYGDGQATSAPTLGNHVVVGGGAQVTGGITLGDYVKVSMNTSVEESFGDHAVLFGVPARNLSKNN